MLEIRHLCKRYRRGVYANHDVCLDLAPGEVFGLLGHNGAGKTTLVNQVAGLLRPTAGTIALNGRDLVADPAFARRCCSLQPQGSPPLSGLRPAEAVEVIGRLRGGARDTVRRRVGELLDGLDLAEWADTPADRLSGGVRRLIGFCMAAVEPGRVVVLDEPTNDVDPVRRRLLWARIRDLADEGSCVLLVTHNVVDAERAVDRLAILQAGRIVAQGTPAELKRSTTTGMRLELLCAAGAPCLPVPPAGNMLAGDDRRRVVVTAADDDVESLVRWAQALRAADVVEDFSLGTASLEDAYVRLAGGAAQPTHFPRDEEGVSDAA